MTFFDRLVSLSAQRGGKPNSFADNIGVSSATLTKWKRGSEPKASNIIQIAQFFGVSTDYLLGLVDNQSESSAAISSFLNKEEQELIENYRKMKRDDQLREGARIQLLAEQAAAETSSNQSEEAM